MSHKNFLHGLVIGCLLASVLGSAAAAAGNGPHRMMPPGPPPSATGSGTNAPAYPPVYTGPRFAPGYGSRPAYGSGYGSGPGYGSTYGPGYDPGYGGPRYNSGPRFGGFGPWNNRGSGFRGPWNNRGNWGDFRNPFSHRSPGSWMNPSKGNMSRNWDDMLNAPSRMGRMPGGWEAPSVSMPNPIDVGDEFRDAARDLPDQMDNFRSNY